MYRLQITVHQTPSGLASPALVTQTNEVSDLGIAAAACAGFALQLEHMDAIQREGWEGTKHSVQAGMALAGQNSELKEELRATWAELAAAREEIVRLGQLVAQGAGEHAEMQRQREHAEEAGQ